MMRSTDRYLISKNFPEGREEEGLFGLKEAIHQAFPEVMVVDVKATCLVIESTEAEAKEIGQQFHCAVYA